MNVNNVNYKSNKIEHRKQDSDSTQFIEILKISGSNGAKREIEILKSERIQKSMFGVIKRIEHLESVTKSTNRANNL